jgi:hypothetical protein
MEAKNKNLPELGTPKSEQTPELSKREENKKKQERQRQIDREPVKGIFRFYEVPGGEMRFVYKAYKGDPVEKHIMIDNQVYTVPLGVAKHLNKSGWYPVHTYAVDENGKPIMKIGQKVRRYGFQSLEFVDVDDLSSIGSPLVTATPIQGYVDQYGRPQLQSL